MVAAIPSKRHVIPVFVFFSLCGFYFIVYQMYASKAPDRFLENHKASEVPVTPSGNLLPYLDPFLEHIPKMDKILTPLISFFVAAFGDTSSSAYPTVAHFVWSFGCAIQVPLVESVRSGVLKRSNGPETRDFATRMLSHPMIWGILYQRLSGGWIIPLWIIFFMLSPTRVYSTSIDSLDAQSVFAGWWLGHTVLALFMLVPDQPALTRTPLWVAFPILMTVFQKLYLGLRWRFSSEHSKESAYFAVQALYASGFIAAFMAHWHLVVIPYLTNASFAVPTHEVMLNKFFGLARSMHAFFLPATGVFTPQPDATTSASGVIHFVQFDVIIVFSALWTALIWDRSLRRDAGHSTQSMRDKVLAIVKPTIALVAGALLLSPGAATSAFLMVREHEISGSGSRKLALKRKSLLPKLDGELPLV